jgi:uncharacterized protein (DUF4415 family)
MKNTSKTNWLKVDTMTDDEIDYTNSPEVTEDLFKLMTKEEPEKVTVNLKLDREIVDFFKTHSKKYQTRINEVLRAMVRSYKNAHSH